MMRFAVGAALLAAIATTGRAAVVYVDADAPGANDGSSWENAYTDLQSALALALVAGDEIRVAQGTYVPGPARADTFQLVAGVKHYGGYAGWGESDPDARDWELYETILSGDIDGNDDPAYEPDDPLRNNGGNSYTVVTGEDSVVVDGFTITGGAGSYGGGMCIPLSALTVALHNCTVADNYASFGGGVYCSSQGALTLLNCLIVGNVAANGGGIYGDLEICYLADCTVEGNRSSSDMGGGVSVWYMGGGVPGVECTRCTFVGNTGRYGGGIFGDSAGFVFPAFYLELTDCVFTGNAAQDYGGAVYATGGVWVYHCTFEGNTAQIGGAFSATASFVPPQELDIDRSDFIGNTASTSAGAVDGADFSEYVAIQNCVFSGNSAPSGGALAIRGGSMIHCSFSGNSADTSGGAIYVESSTPTADVVRSILWGDSAPSGPEIWYDGPPACTVSYSNVAQAGGFLDGGNNLNVDPLFVDADGIDDVPGTSDDNLRIGADSPCIDVLAAFLLTDRDGNTRRDDPGCDNVGGIGDIGAYEFLGTSTPVITLTAPLGGETWVLDDAEAVTWGVAGGRVNEVRVEFSRDGGTSWEHIDGGTPVPNASSFAWVPTVPTSTACRARVSHSPSGLPSGESPADYSLVNKALAVSFDPATVSEGDGTLSLAGTVSVPKPVTGDVVVNLSSSDETELMVPSQVTIGDGTSSADFDLTIEDDAVVDGPRTAIVTATAASYSSAAGSVVVADDDPVVLTLPADLTEGGPPVEATIQLDEPAEANAVFAITSSDTTALVVSATAGLAAGETQVGFYLIPVNDGAVDGTQTATVTVSAPGWAQGSGTLDVLDDDVSSGGDNGGGCLAGSGGGPLALLLPLGVALLLRRRSTARA